jgi:ATP-binding cassette subfamily B protein
MPLNRFRKLRLLEKKDLYTIYTFAIFSGIIQLSLPLGVQSIIGFVISGVFSVSIVLLIGLILTGIFFAGLLQIMQMNVIEKVQQKLFHFYAFRFSGQLLDINMGSVQDAAYPEWTNRFLDITTLQKSLTKILLDIPLASIQIVLGLFIISIYHPLFLLMVFVLLLIVFIIFYLSSSTALQTSIKESSYKYEVSSWLQQMARAVHSFKLNRTYQLHDSKLDNRVTSYLDYRTRHFKILLFQFKNLIFLKIMITAAMLILGTYLLLNQQLNIGQFVAAEIIIITMIGSVEKLITNLDSLYDCLTSFEKLETFSHEEQEVNGSITLPQQSEGMAIELRDIRFGYGDRPAIFENLNLSIQAGEKLLITGGNGAGKSSLLRIITSLYHPQSGSINYNQTPKAQLNLFTLRQEIGVALGQPEIFSGNIFDNIAIGNPDISIPHMMNLCRKAGVESAILQMEKGFDTELDLNSRKLPRTLWKKILILRAIAGNKALIVLDEPFAELDDQSAKDLLQVILECTKNSTLVISTQGHLFDDYADRIIRLDSANHFVELKNKRNA